MICKNCGNVVKDNQTFCEFCGTRLTNQIFCPICGEKNDDGKFCRNCGASLPNNSNNTQQPLRAIPNHYDNNSIENKQEQKKRTSGIEIIFNLIFILLGIGLLALNVFACFSDFLVLEVFDITQKITLE
ncbi:MAG: zinc-ribbon domain-containing protein, partial [Anaeroplasmataceae bacterium]|nr:zinc-ribbon domain-containing protein [Anaeroplasmataceae bacterium]